MSTAIDSPTLTEAATDPVTSRRKLQFTVKGLPAPQGSKSFKGFSRAGHAILTESSERVRPWRQDVVIAAEDAIRQNPGFTPFDGPVHLIIEFYMPRPKGAPKTRRVVPDKTPDLSKLLRSTEDAMTTAAVWRDDAQVVDTTMRKRYATFGDDTIGHPWELPGIGAVVTVIEVDHDDTWADQPLDVQAGARFPLPALPAPLVELTAQVELGAHATADLEQWGSDAVTIPTSMTDGKARAAVGKLLAESERRAARLRSEEIAPERAIALIIEDGAARLASPSGKPATAMQVDITNLATHARDEATEIVVILAGRLS